MSRAKKFLDQPVWVRVLRGLALSALTALFAYLVPTPYQLTAPGPAQEVAQQIQMEARTYSVKGKFLMPTVLTEPASLLYCLYALLDPDAQLTDRDTSQLHAQGPGQMALSQYYSTRIALKAAGFRVEGQFEGLEVMGLMEDSPNKDHLQAGDVLKQFNGQNILSLGELRNSLNALPADAEFEVILQRDQKDKKELLEVFRLGDRNLIGVRLRPKFSHMELPFQVRFEETSTIGASGGLVFALEIYNRLTPLDLTRGRTIAATGTLDAQGEVGEISGLRHKLVGAERAGADILLAPTQSIASMGPYESSVKVLGVRSFQEALNALK